MTQKLQFWTTTLVVFSCQEAIIDPSCPRSHGRGAPGSIVCPVAI